jgi:hypothetical protein
MRPEVNHGYLLKCNGLRVISASMTLLVIAFFWNCL